MSKVIYKRTQAGRNIMATVALILLVMIGSNWWQSEAVVWPGISIALIVLALFFALTIEVTATHVSWYFGFGFWRRKVAIKDIVSVQEEQFGWLNGYGIRRIADGWLYRVDGKRALLLTKTDGKRVALGSHDVAGLKAAIVEVMKN
jgi:hypothetical protein